MQRPIPLRRVALAIYIALNLVAVIFSIEFGTGLDDWRLWQSLPNRLANGTAYVPAQGLPPFVWSPVAAWFMSVIAIIGYWPWVVAHIAVLRFLRSPMLILVTASSWAFWWDMASAHAMTFVLVSGIAAMRGGRFGALAYLGLLLLMPRPVQVPLAVWLLWQDRSLWRPFAIMIFVHFAVVIASGLGPAWIVASVAYTASDGLGIGPTRLFGVSWLIIGLIAASWLTWRGRPGWAGVMITPYLLPQYLLMPLVDWRAAAHHTAMDSRPTAVASLMSGLAELRTVRTRGTFAVQEHPYAVPMDLAPAGVLGGAGDQGGLGRQEDRIGAVGVQE